MRNSCTSSPQRGLQINWQLICEYLTVTHDYIMNPLGCFRVVVRTLPDDNIHDSCRSICVDSRSPSTRTSFNPTSLQLAQTRHGENTPKVHTHRENLRTFLTEPQAKCNRLEAATVPSASKVCATIASSVRGDMCFDTDRFSERATRFLATRLRM